MGATAVEYRREAPTTSLFSGARTTEAACEAAVVPEAAPQAPLEPMGHADEELQLLTTPTRTGRPGSFPISPLRHSRSSGRGTPQARRVNSEQSLISTGPMCMLILVVMLSVLVLVQMIVRDMSATASLGDCQQLKIPKHHHCVGSRGSSFSEFLWQQGARREHPLAAAAAEGKGEGKGTDAGEGSAKHGARQGRGHEDDAHAQLDPDVFTDNATWPWTNPWTNPNRKQRS